MKNKIPWVFLAGIGAYWMIERLGKRGGASDAEVHVPLPGDDIVPHPMLETTHAISIHAPASLIWKWLIQAGYRGSGRAGWYSDRRLFLPLEKAFLRMTVPQNLLFLDPEMHSVDEILPAYQNTMVGDIIPDGPPNTAYFIVEQVEPERVWALYSNSHLKYLSPTFLHGTAFEAQGEFSWVFVLNPIGERVTRLILRTRANFGPKLFRRMILPFVFLSEAIIPRLILGGIKQRAEHSVKGEMDPRPTTCRQPKFYPLQYAQPDPFGTLVRAQLYYGW